MSWGQLVQMIVVVLAIGYGFEYIAKRLDTVIDHLTVISDNLQTIVDTKHPESETEPYGP